MELEELTKLAKNLHDHLHSRKKTDLTEDEYRVCQSLLNNDIDLGVLFRGLLIINNEVISFGDLRISRRGQNG